VLQLGDLGIAKLCKDGVAAKTQIGTPHYMAPEVWMGKAYSFSSDIFSLGYGATTNTALCTGGDHGIPSLLLVCAWHLPGPLDQPLCVPSVQVPSLRAHVLQVCRIWWRHVPPRDDVMRCSVHERACQLGSCHAMGFSVQLDSCMGKTGGIGDDHHRNEDPMYGCQIRTKRPILPAK
jgi:serine/threonine protein kinase